jgi:peptide/nickel transport system permease protein
MHIRPWNELRKNASCRIACGILVFLALLAVLAPWVAPIDPNRQTREAFQPPSATHLLGTNHVGQDHWSRLVYGARTSLTVGFSVALLATLISALVGGTCALRGGFYDLILMRVVDGLLIIPAIIILILITAYLKPTLSLLVALISFFSWAAGARIVRAQALSLKQRPHIWAGKSFGGTRGYVLRRHLLPELGPILVVEFIHNFRRAVFMEAGLAFLGICDPITVSWGVIMKNAVDYSYMNGWLWWLIPAGVALSATILSLAWIGQSLEPILEPRLKELAHA